MSKKYVQTKFNPILFHSQRIVLTIIFIFLGLGGLNSVIQNVFYPSTPANPPTRLLGDFFVSLFSVFCFLAAYGLFRKQLKSILFGRIAAFFILIMFVFEFFNHWSEFGSFDLADILWGVLFFFTPVVIFFKLNYVKESLKKFKKY